MSPETDGLLLANNTFQNCVTDWGYMWCELAGAEVLPLDDDREVRGRKHGICVGAGDWVVADRRGGSGTYGVSHEDYSIVPVKLRAAEQYDVQADQRSAPVVPSTVELMRRWQWISWFFSNYESVLDPTPLDAWRSLDEIHASFNRERSLILEDDHIAMYWLSHFAILDEVIYEEIRELLCVPSCFVKDAIEFLDVFIETKNFPVRVPYGEDAASFAELIPQRHANALHYVYNIGSYSGERAFDHWWRAFRLYPKVNETLPGRVGFLVKNVDRNGLWRKIDEALDKEPELAKAPLVSYIHLMHPGAHDVESAAGTFVGEVEKNCVLWGGQQRNTVKRMLFLTHRKLPRKRLKKLVAFFYEDDTASEDYLAIQKGAEPPRSGSSGSQDEELGNKK